MCRKMDSSHTAQLQNLTLLVFGMRGKGRPTLGEHPPPQSHEGTPDTSPDPPTTLCGRYCYMPLIVWETGTLRGEAICPL